MGRLPVAKAKAHDKYNGAFDRLRSLVTPKGVPLQGAEVVLGPMKGREHGFSPNSKPQLITWSQLAPLHLRISGSHSCTGISASGLHSSPSTTPGFPRWTGHRAKTNSPLSSHPFFLKSKEHHFSQMSLFLSLICVLTGSSASLKSCVSAGSHFASLEKNLKKSLWVGFPNQRINLPQRILISTYYGHQNQTGCLKVWFSSISIILFNVVKFIDPNFPKSLYQHVRGTVYFPFPSSLCQEEVSLEHVACDDSLAADNDLLFSHVCPGPPVFLLPMLTVQCIKDLTYMIWFSPHNHPGRWGLLPFFILLTKRLRLRRAKCIVQTLGAMTKFKPRSSSIVQALNCHHVSSGRANPTINLS